MSIDRLFNNTYHKSSYNCAHFVVDVWAHLTGNDITHTLAGFLLPPKDRHVDYKRLHDFRKLEHPESPCIVLMQRLRTAPHVGVYYKNKVLHITEQGVQFMPLDIATFGFSKVRFYAC